MVVLWALFALFCLIIELNSPSLCYFLSFATGGFLASFISLFIDSILFQSIVFCVGTVTAFLVLRYLLAESAEQHTHQRTNFFALQGKQGIVTKEIQPYQSGMVKIDREVWTALSMYNTTIKEGSLVEVVKVKGVCLIVRDITE